MPQEQQAIAGLDQQKQDLVGEYIYARESGARAELTRLEMLLDNLYWRYVEAILSGKVSAESESLEFTEQERLLLNMGLLDERLVAGADEGLRERLLAEMNQPGMVNHFYLSEWLDDRFKRMRVNLQLTSGGEDEEGQGGGSKFELSRDNILKRLAPLLQGLQGVSQDVAQAIGSGRLDVQLLNMGVNLLGNNLRRELMTRHRLWDLRRQVLTRARARTQDPRELKFFDVLDNLYQMEWRGLYQERLNAPSMTPEERREHQQRERRKAEQAQLRQKALDFILAELHFARSLLPLGALAGGIMRPCAVLTADAPRVTKQDTGKMLAKAGICDRNFAASPVILIAPFRGRGIYEWDRDSLVISLNPVESPADSAANSVGNYTMMIDSLQKGGLIKAAYKSRFPKANFQRDFQADYRCWLCRVAEGTVDALPAEKLEFFRAQVGLDLAGNPAASLAPVEMRFLTPPARHIIRTQLRKQIATARDSWGTRWRLGLLCWMDGSIEEALKEITNAAKLVPEEASLLMGVGLLLKQSGRLDKARQILQICLRRGRESIWRLYAQQALEELDSSAAPSAN